MNKNIINYFSSEKLRLKANFHTHTILSDGMMSAEDAVSLYSKLGYHVLALSDHDIYKEYSGDKVSPLIIPALEITKGGCHVLQVGSGIHVAPNSDRQEVINAIKKNGAFSVICHPNQTLLF
ncbi:MAG: PHP domain-containing protein [Fibrobacterota bacterium]